MTFFTPDLIIFIIKAFVVVIAIVLSIAIPAVIIKKLGKSDKKRRLKIKNLKEKYEKYITELNSEILDKKELKKYLKTQKQKDKKQKDKKATSFVIQFDGDTMATQVESLREEITLILNIAKPKDEVILILESRGGSVAHYGLAASQLQRLRDKNIKLTICVDRVAGSGGYLMACVANQIIAAPFAYIGSIGVLFGIPNVHEFLKKHDISYEEITAGKYKRTLTLFGEVTEDKRERIKEQLALIHDQFKNFVHRYRQNIKLEEVATGEAWLAEEALKKNLVDKIQTSDDYIMEMLKVNQVYKVELNDEKSLMDKLSDKFDSQTSITEKLTEKFLPFFLS